MKIVSQLVAAQNVLPLPLWKAVIRMSKQIYNNISTIVKNHM